jgi:multidrug efflux pump subunit AcrB
MNLSEFSVKNYQFTLVAFLAVLSLGVYSLLTMPRGEDPDFESPQFFVTVVYPGTNPIDMEQLVADRVEKRLSALDDIKRIRTDIDDGLALFRIEYVYESDPDDKYQEIVREVSALRQELPADIADIRIQQLTPTSVSIYQWALVSENVSYGTLQKTADAYMDELEKIKSLQRIEGWGYPGREVSIELNLEKMAQDKIPVSQVLGAIQSEAVNIPGGSVSVGTKKFNVKTSGDYDSLDEIRNTIVYSTGQRVVFLKDIATVRLGYGDEKHITRLNGHRCVFVTCSQKSGQNILSVRDQVEPVEAAFKADLPPSIDLVRVFDQPESVATRLARFAKDFSIAILLVLVTLLPLGTRASVVVMISIPLSLAIGLTLLNLLGININQLSIVGMIVALGILVDDSIVVVENIERFLRMGYSRTRAAIEASKQIGLAVVGCTILLMFAFLPLVFLPEAAGDFIKGLPLAVITTVFASMIVSLTVVPFLSSKLLSRHASTEGNVFMRLLKRGIAGSYGRLLDTALKHPVVTLVVAFAIFGATMALIPRVGFSLFPKSEKPMFMVNVELPVGTNLQATERVVRHVEGVLRQTPGVRNFSTNVGRGNPRIYYNVVPKGETANFGQVFVQLEKETGTKEKVALIDRLRERLAGYPGAKIEVRDFEQGPPVEAPIAYRIYGENLDTLRAVAARVEAILAAHPGAIYTDNPLKVQPTDLKVRINKEKAGLLGVPVAEVDRMVRLGIAGLNVGTYRDEDSDEYPLNVSVARPGAVPAYDVFDQIYVNNVLGTAVPLRNIATVELQTSPNQIRHYDKNRYVTVSTFLKTGYNTQRVNDELVEKLDAFRFPDGFTYGVAGEKESQQESFGGLGFIILITVFGFVAVLILEFKSFKSILIVLSVIPLGAIGAVLILWAWGETLSFTATIGLIALVGIEVKNSLLLVDFTNQLREQGRGLEEAIREAGEIRFVPIVLTSLTAIGGLIPLVVEYSQLYSPLALVLIGGIISSTLLSRLVTPVMYKLLPPRIEAAEVPQPAAHAWAGAV